MTRPTPLTSTARTTLAADLRRLADQLETSDAHTVQQALAAAADNVYPARASGTSRTPHNTVDEDGQPIPPDSITEHRALHPDPTARHATEVLARLRALVVDAPALTAALAAWDPARSIAACRRCGHPYQRGYNRCQNIIDGAQCGSSERNDRRCRICDKLMRPNEPLREGRCNPCRMFRARHGHDKNTATRLALDANLLTDDGTYHAEAS